MRRDSYYVNTIAKRARNKTHLFIKYTFLYPFTLVLVLGLVVSYFVYKTYANELASKQRLLNNSNTGLTLKDDKGKVFFTFYNARTPKHVSLSQVPLHTQQALISAEDRDFYKNPGFSTKGIVRAAFTNAKHGGIKEGGSTLSQELIKMQVLGPEKSFQRKAKEVILSVNLNRIYTKNDILEMYLNSAYFGEGAVGIENAAQVYFGKNSKDLSISESALLVGLLPAPSVLSPFSNDQSAAYIKQKQVLQAMLDEEYISTEQFKHASSSKLVFNKQKSNENTLAPHFALYVKDQIIKEFGEERVVRSGFIVETTLNEEWQKTSQNLVKEHVKSLQTSDASNGAVVIIEPKTGYIKTMVGSHNWYDNNNGKINMALSPRQPGSSFKPIIYAKGLEKGTITTATLIQDVPKVFAGNYKPQNYDSKYRGPVTVRRALANSLNIPAVEIMSDVGIRQAVSTSQSFGISTIQSDTSKYGNSFVLGAVEAPLVDMIAAYSVFANGGVYTKPTGIVQISDKYGATIYKHIPEKKRILSEEVAYLITSILSDKGARSEIFGNVLDTNNMAAVKTGTSELYIDSWTIGYTPNLVVGAWVGNNDNTPMNKVAGSLGAAPIWKGLINEFSEAEQFKQPTNIIKAKVCLQIPEEKKEEEDDDDKKEDKKKDKDGDDDDKKEEELKFKTLIIEDYFVKGTEPLNCIPTPMKNQHLQIAYKFEDDLEQAKISTISANVE